MNPPAEARWPSRQPGAHLGIPRSAARARRCAAERGAEQAVKVCVFPSPVSSPSVRGAQSRGHQPRPLLFPSPRAEGGSRFQIIIFWLSRIFSAKRVYFLVFDRYLNIMVISIYNIYSDTSPRQAAGPGLDDDDYSGLHSLHFGSYYLRKAECR